MHKFLLFRFLIKVRIHLLDYNNVQNCVQNLGLVIINPNNNIELFEETEKRYISDILCSLLVLFLERDIK